MLSRKNGMIERKGRTNVRMNKMVERKSGMLVRTNGMLVLEGALTISSAVETCSKSLPHLI